MESELILSAGGLPPLSARGCVQHLMPIVAGELRRTINGALIYTGKPLGQKYRSIISCEDKAVLAMEGLWPGSNLRVGCIQRLWHKASTQAMILERDPMEGTVFAMTSTQKDIEIQKISGREVKLGPLSGDVFVSYRPWLDMRVVTFTLMTNEWGVKAGWRLELEEV